MAIKSTSAKSPLPPAWAELDRVNELLSNPNRTPDPVADKYLHGRALEGVYQAIKDLAAKGISDFKKYIDVSPEEREVMLKQAAKAINDREASHIKSPPIYGEK